MLKWRALPCLLLLNCEAGGSNGREELIRMWAQDYPVQPAADARVAAALAGAPQVQPHTHLLLPHKTRFGVRHRRRSGLWEILSAR